MKLLKGLLLFLALVCILIGSMLITNLTIETTIASLLIYTAGFKTGITAIKKI